MTVISFKSVQTNLHVLDQTPFLLSQMTILRDSTSSHAEFVHAANHISRLIASSALSHVRTTKKIVRTHSNETYTGIQFSQKVCCVSILRAGESMESAVRETYGPLPVGKLLIQRDEVTSKAELFYCKIPGDAPERVVLLLDPMLATGGSVMLAIQALIDRNVDESNIVYLSFISSRAGIDRLLTKYPKLRIVTAAVDPTLNEENYIVPGCGDFGDRYYGTSSTIA
ncbi:uracil phosphoribosyltransferase [Schizosaccharomyces japonicus yFS275]|uniref:uracil phosphoribosyltransferase n=1 Tax=Schizosaccharomyces japonicus (strain yFS275 / FY16936) TaxID=402676 RepID=B6K7J9_SCHJY|nr:uracil phosphoribosyltransferase [Schizosaccharomyces japonicus yFS275]EEB09503.1 uracil phosphoribosyltransferase [Schizosaccharomyces japonicus yFS275]